MKTASNRPSACSDNRAASAAPFRRLALHSAIATALLGGGYGRQAYAGSCTLGPVSVCSVAADSVTDTTQTVTGTPLTITTTDGFGIDTTTTGGNGLTLTGTDGLTFIDNYFASITGYNIGIYARNYATGALSITSTGTVTGTYGAGIYARNDGTDLTLETAAVTGGDEEGIIARNFGTGALSVTSTGTVTGAYGAGIDARNYGTDLTLSTAEVTAYGRGIAARNFGSGALSITSTGTVTSTVTSSVRDGIYAFNSSDGTDLTLNTEEVTAYGNGVYARNFGSGALSITSTGAVTSTFRYGIITSNHGTDLRLNTAAVTGYRDGIFARNYGTGALSITSTGTVTGADGDGVSARNSSDGSDLTLNTAAVTGYDNGIYARNSGAGALSITSSGTVTGTNYDGIDARNYGTDLTLNTATVTGGEKGIYARNYGAGALSITSTGDVRGIRYGIDALNYGTDLTLNTAAVAGGFRGIVARNYGSGALSITSTGTVTGADGDGITARNYGTDLTLNTAEVTGSGNGIDARNYEGTGALSITSTGTVTGNGDGIYARNDGTGALSITSSGTVTGTNNDGITALNNGTDLTLSTGSVTGGTNAIEIIQDGSGLLSITTAGVVTGEAGHALLLDRSVAGTTTGTITNNGSLISEQLAAVMLSNDLNFDGSFDNNGTITGGNGTAVDASATSNGIVFNQNAGTINGDILLGSGDDVVTIYGGVINGQIIGTGTGIVNIDVGAGNSFIADGGVVNVQDYNIQSGTVYQQADFSTASTTTTINEGATLSFNTTINGSGALVSEGDLEFVVGSDTSGQLIQAGSVTLNEGSSITLVFGDELSPTLGDSLSLINATSLIDNGVVVHDDLFLFDFTAVIAGGDVSVQAAIIDLEALSPLDNVSAFGASLGDFINEGGSNAVVDYLVAELGDKDVSGFEQVADVFSPSVSGAVMQGALDTNNATWRLINDRFIGAEGSAQANQQQGAWLQAFIGSSAQDSANDVEGFDGDGSGIAMGYDYALQKWRLGVAYGSAESTLDNDRFARDEITVDSDQLTVYSGFNRDQWFANASISLASLDYAFERTNLIADEGNIRGDTDADMLSIGVGAGYQYGQLGDLSITPLFGLRYTSLDVGDYTEQGGLNLNVAYDSTETLTTELGVSGSAQYALGEWQLAPSGRLAWSHEYLGENERASARYAGQSFALEGFEPDQDQFSLGLGVELSNKLGLNLSLDYDVQLSGDYVGHQGSLAVRYTF